MRMRRVVALLAPMVVAAALGGCRTAGMPMYPIRQYDGSQLITAEIIAQARSTNAWDLLREVGTQFRFGETPMGAPASLRTRRGRSSLVLREADIPVLIVDGVRMSDPFYLREIPTNILWSIRLLSGIDGATRYGLNAGAGVIIVTTQVPYEVLAPDPEVETADRRP